MNEQEKNAILTIEQQNKALAGINQEMDLLNLLRIMLQQEIEALQSQQDLIKLLIEKQKNK